MTLRLRVVGVRTATVKEKVPYKPVGRQLERRFVLLEPAGFANAVALCLSVCVCVWVGGGTTKFRDS